MIQYCTGTCITLIIDCTITIIITSACDAVMLASERGCVALLVDCIQITKNRECTFSILYLPE